MLVEGAGSPAEINLRAGDIANMGFAQAANLPVVIVADIDRGGAIASLVGTQALLAEDDAALIGGFIVNNQKVANVSMGRNSALADGVFLRRAIIYRDAESRLLG